MAASLTPCVLEEEEFKSRIMAAVAMDQQFPPGYRFVPRDEELIEHYLMKKIRNLPLPINKIRDEDVYKYSPYQLAEKYSPYEDGEKGKEWYFFTPRERKYPNGNRPRRDAGDGYWKATGVDKEIRNSTTKAKIGSKRALVFYIGKPSEKKKTPWIMYEYLVVDKVDSPPSCKTRDPQNHMKLDDLILCRIFNQSRRSNSKASKNDDDNKQEEKDEKPLEEDNDEKPLEEEDENDSKPLEEEDENDNKPLEEGEDNSINSVLISSPPESNENLMASSCTTESPEQGRNLMSTNIGNCTCNGIDDFFQKCTPLSSFGDLQSDYIYPSHNFYSSQMVNGDDSMVEDSLQFYEPDFTMCVDAVWTFPSPSSL